MSLFLIHLPCRGGALAEVKLGIRPFAWFLRSGNGETMVRMRRKMRPLLLKYVAKLGKEVEMPERVLELCDDEGFDRFFVELEADPEAAARRFFWKLDENDALPLLTTRGESVGAYRIVAINHWGLVIGNISGHPRDLLVLSHEDAARQLEVQPFWNFGEWDEERDRAARPLPNDFGRWLPG